ncbi:MAG: hypothetical protein RBS37_11290, partial [Bacteroidales bacterium]|nr:hypothetical protein [Bacteroidales bacterium]
MHSCPRDRWKTKSRKQRASVAGFFLVKHPIEDHTTARSVILFFLPDAFLPARQMENKKP